MNDEVKGLSTEERHDNKVIYTGKRIYKLMCELKTEIVGVQGRGVTADELGTFGELDLEALIAEARELGNVPVWNAETTPVGKKLTYPGGTTGVN